MDSFNRPEKIRRRFLNKYSDKKQKHSKSLHGRRVIDRALDKFIKLLLKFREAKSADKLKYREHIKPLMAMFKEMKHLLDKLGARRPQQLGRQSLLSGFQDASIDSCAFLQKEIKAYGNKAQKFDPKTSRTAKEKAEYDLAQKNFRRLLKVCEAMMEAQMDPSNLPDIGQSQRCLSEVVGRFHRSKAITQPLSKPPRRRTLRMTQRKIARMTASNN